MAVAEAQGTGPIQRPSVSGRLKMPHSPTKALLQTKEELKKQADRLAKKAEEHEHVINKITYVVGVAMFGTFCFLLGSKPQTIPYLYCLFFLIALPLRWIYYRSKKWHYYLLDFCYYANVIFIAMLLFFPNNDKLFLVCFSFAEGPLAWAIIVWRCSLVFSSIDKIVSVLIHLLPGTVLFIIRWWDPVTYAHHDAEETGPWPAWPVVGNEQQLWLWLFAVPLCVYSIWQMLYWIIVHGLRNQRILNDPEVMTSYRELSRKAARANNIFWRLSGILGDNNRVTMYAVFQGLFTVATLALTVPMFKHYRLHLAFQIFKVSAAIWNGGNFFFDVMPRQVVQKKEMKGGQKVVLKTAPEASSSNPGEGGGGGQDGRVATPPADGGTPPSGRSPFGRADDTVSPDLGNEGQQQQAQMVICAMCRQPSLPIPDEEDGTVALAPDASVREVRNAQLDQGGAEAAEDLDRKSNTNRTVGGQALLAEDLLEGAVMGGTAAGYNVPGFVTSSCVSGMGSGDVRMPAFKQMACAS